MAVGGDTMKVKNPHEFIGKYGIIEKERIVGDRQLKHRTWKTVVYMVGSPKRPFDYVIAIESSLN